MHNENSERADARDDDSELNAVIAADDTGMVLQQEILVRSELDEGPIEADDIGPEAEDR
ncbi:MAG: hypothetical protein IAI50_00730 [Candidatus Eremiobacteraeota bacterium]|nr:hypothetical protein [Candidatus Eremiobacteraeota bacterium]